MMSNQDGGPQLGQYQDNRGEPKHVGLDEPTLHHIAKTLLSPSSTITAKVDAIGTAQQ
jgi:hypothetical protein